MIGICLMICGLAASFLLIACAAAEEAAESENARSASDCGSDPVLACDQVQNRVVLYDPSRMKGTNLDSCEIWSYRPSRPTCINVSGVKYRKDTVFGDVILIVASGGYAGIIRYPEGIPVWETEYCGRNPHSIELLPDGNLVTAASQGGTLHLYTLSVLANGGSAADIKDREYSFPDAHGVLWDPEYQRLWAVGEKKLAAYTVSGSGSDTELLPDRSRGGVLPGAGGHDLSADFQDKNGLWITSSLGVVRFDKKTNSFSYQYDHAALLNLSDVKGFGNHPNGHFFFCRPNGGLARSRDWNKKSISGWCTDEISYCSYDIDGEFRQTDLVSEVSAFYKVFCFCGRYQ